MNVLWITNITLPEAQSLLSGNSSHKASGGWMLGLADALLKQFDIKLTVASVSRSVKKLTRLEGDKIVYYVLPGGWKGQKRINHSLEPLWRTVKEEVRPAVIHFHGTEGTHCLAWLEACGPEHVCASIQGLVSAYYYYYYGLSRRQIFFSTTPMSLLRGGIMSGYRDFRLRAESEKEIIRRIGHIIGRTSWDRQRTWAINPTAQYHHGGEILRGDFYEGLTWSYDDCKKHSIFATQAGYPIKGFHMLLRAMPLILRHFPDATIRVAGRDITQASGLVERMKVSDYGNIIRKEIRKLNLSGKVEFTGPLSGAEMRNEYLSANVFVCPSTIENSPNSLGEAQVLGVPVVASYVGGVMDMMSGDEEHLYRFEEVEMLAFKICDLFEKGDAVDTSAMREKALKRHNPQAISEEIMNIYNCVKADN